MITPKNMADSSKTHIVNFMTAALSAGSDVADFPAFRAPKDIEIIEIGIMPTATYTGHADKSTWLFENGSSAIATKEYTATEGHTPPSANTYDSMGAITAANKKMSEGDILSYSITNGAGAATPICMVQIEYIVDEVL